MTTGALRAVAALIAIGLSGSAQAQVRRALVVGIDRYSGAPPGALAANRGTWGNLRGAVNDAKAFRDALVKRFHFDSRNVTTLFDEEASRERILATFRRALIDEAKPGDVTVFYYAGHGSQVLNSLSPELDKLDETLVPSDTRGGAPDIRDKELVRLLLEAAARTRLTVVLDACHSGGMSRGAAPLPDWRLRVIAADRDHDARDPELAPDLRDVGPYGILVLAAAEDRQPAGEGRDPRGKPRGYFTLTLLDQLSRMPVDAPAEDVFKSVKAAMQRGAPGGDNQEPILFASADRLRAPLVGFGTPASSGGTVAVTRIQQDGAVVLQAGKALLVGPGTVLRRESPDGKVARLVVTEVPGMSASLAKRIEGDSRSVREGDLFTIERWVPPAEARLRVALDPAVPADLARALAAMLGPANGPSFVELVPAGQEAVDYRLAPADAPEKYVWVRQAPSSTRLPAATAAVLLRSHAVGEVTPAAEQLAGMLARLARARALLTLASDTGDSEFPYRPVLEGVDDGAEVKDGKVSASRRFRLALTYDGKPDERQRWERHFVYVVDVDAGAAISVLYPREGADVENHLPVLEGGGNFGPAPDRVPGPGGLVTLKFAEPFGDETLLLLASRDAIPTIHALAQPGVLELPVGGPVASRWPGASRGGRPAAWIVRRIEFSTGP
jgi:hypothetical protein